MNDYEFYLQKYLEVKDHFSVSEFLNYVEHYYHERLSFEELFDEFQENGVLILVEVNGEPFFQNSEKSNYAGEVKDYSKSEFLKACSKSANQ